MFFKLFVLALALVAFASANPLPEPGSIGYGARTIGIGGLGYGGGLGFGARTIGFGGYGTGLGLGYERGFYG